MRMTNDIDFNRRSTQMNADDFPDLQSGKAETFPCKEEAHAIIGCAFEVLNELGHGLNEKLYENSLVVEFKRRSIAFDQQRRFEVLYKGEHAGEFIPDLIAYGKVVVDVKCIDRITDHERGQMLNYLRITRLPVGLILSFKHAKLEFERIVLSTADKRR
jgi:GxxExxY protein